MTDLRLGKNPYVPDSRDITFAAVKAAAATPLPVPPARFGHGGAFRDWGMLANDRLGDCVPADALHATMLWTKLGDPATAVFTDKEAEAAYTLFARYDPADPSTDQGTNMREAMSAWKYYGIRDAAGKQHQIGAYISVNPKDVTELMEAVYVFGWAHIGFQFPAYAFDQFRQGRIWDVQSAGNQAIEGGHCVGATGRTSSLNLNMGMISWGKRQGMSAAFYEKYNDETWVTVSEDELRAGRNERGFDLTGLLAALNQL